MIFLQCFLFFAIATLQAITGLGGGTLYISALTLTNVNYLYIPVIALLSNTISASTASYIFYRKKCISLNIIKPFLITALPCAYIGASLNLPEKVFSVLMLIVMLTICVKMFFVHIKKPKTHKKPPLVPMLILGVLAGTLSGIIGIGGAIFLVPFMYYYNVADAKTITASAVFFVFINSSIGLIGHIIKLTDLSFIYYYLPLLIAALIGGKTGSLLTATKIPAEKIKYITSGVIFAVSIKIIVSLF